MHLKDEAPPLYNGGSGASHVLEPEAGLEPTA